MLKKHNKRGPCIGLAAAAVLAAGLLFAAPVAKPVYAESTPAPATAYVGFSAVSDVKVNDVSVKKYGYYHIAFDANGGSGSIDQLTLVTDQTEELPKNIFTRKGYTWMGWNTQADGTGTAYRDGQSVKNLTDKSDSIITLYAQWSANSYTATFNLNGKNLTISDKELVSAPAFAEESPSKITKKTDEAIGTLPSVTRRGYTFEGWYTAADGGTKISESTPMPGEDATYYAHYKLIDYPIRYAVGYGRKMDGWPSSYTIEDTFTISQPGGISNGIIRSGSGTEEYFTGWRVNGVSGYPESLTISKGKCNGAEFAGAKVFNATWSAEGFRVTCEDWFADCGDGSVWNGSSLPYDTHENETYEGLGNQASRHRTALINDNLPSHYVKYGSTASGADWGDDTHIAVYYNWTQYSGATHSTITGNTTVYRYFNYHGYTQVWNISGSRYAASQVVRRGYVFIDGKWEKTSYTWTRNADGVDFSVCYPDGVSIEKAVISGISKSDIVELSDGYTYDGNEFVLTKDVANAQSVAWINDGSAVTRRNPCLYRTSFDESTGIWVKEYVSDDYRQFVKSMRYKVDSTEYDIEDFFKQSTLPRDCTVTLLSVEMANDQYVFDTLEYAYCGLLYKPGDTARVSLPCGSRADSLEIVDNGYAVRYDANGGTGNMGSQYVANASSSAKAKENGFSNQFADFLGWSTDPDASEPEIKAGDNLLAKLGEQKPGSYKTLYAVWEWREDNASSGAKQKQTLMDTNW